MKLSSLRRNEPDCFRADDGFTVVENLVSLVVIAIVMTAFAGVVLATVGEVRTDDARARASQLAGKQVEQMRSVAWVHAGIVAAPGSPTCSSSELVRTSAAPTIPWQPTPIQLGGLTFAITNVITWVGQACGTVDPTFGTLRLTSRVDWTDAGRSLFTVTTDFRAPGSDIPAPAAGSSPSPAASPTVAPSPSPSPSPSASSSPSPGVTASPSPTALPVPQFSAFTPAYPNATFCVYNGGALFDVPIAVHISNISAGEAVTITWTGPPAPSAPAPMSFQSTQADGSQAYAYTVPAGTPFSTGATTFTIAVAASGSHQPNQNVTTFTVAAAQNKTRC